MTTANDYVPAKRHRAMTVGESVRNCRLFNALSQAQLAKLAGIPQSAISAIESNELKLGVERAKRLAIALNVHPAVLLFPDWAPAKPTSSRRAA
jgi:transcriptional regulator with XRE-family HTH domain